MSNIVKKKHGSLNLADTNQIMEFAIDLKRYIDNNKLSINIEDKKYPLEAAWKFAGMNFGLTGVPLPPVPLHNPKDMIIGLYVNERRFNTKTKQPYDKQVAVYFGPADQQAVIDGIRLAFKDKIIKEIARPFFNYKCDCNIVKVKGGSIVSFGQGMASNLEEGKEFQAEFAVNALSQTRAVSRGFKNVLSFVMSSAGFENTPGEEMERNKANEYQDANVIDQPVMSDSDYKIAYHKVATGEWTLEFIKRNSSLSPAQEEALRILEENRS